MRQISVKSLAMVVGLAAVLVGCGSSSSSDLKALCKQGCDKVNTCAPGFIDPATCKSGCDSMNFNCTNSAAVASAANNCLSMACAGFLACDVPDCETGAGGSGGGGSGGSGNTDAGGN
jgi:hypothetical protein